MASAAPTYTMGHTSHVTKSHSSRTVDNSASFLLPHLKPSMSLLDIGCGPGTITIGFSAHLPHGRIVGIDYSDTVIAEANANLLSKAPSVTNVSFQAASVFALPFDDASFDVVYAHQLFPHLPDAVDALKEVYRVLKPGGIAATRDADTFSWYPVLPGLELYSVTLSRLLRMGGAVFPPGRHMPVWAREAGFAREKMLIGAGATVHATAEERAWWGEVLIGRFTKDEHYREKVIESGTSSQEIETMVRDLEIWIREMDGWYALLQCENIFRK